MGKRFCGKFKLDGFLVSNIHGCHLFGGMQIVGNSLMKAAADDFSFFLDQVLICYLEVLIEFDDLVRDG